jgi:hypothetical protein
VDTFSVVTTGGGVEGTVSNLTFDSATGAGSFDVTFADGAADSTVYVRVQDSDGAASSVATVDVAVSNVAPTPAIASIGAVWVEGTAIAVVGSAADPADANDTLTYSWVVFKNGGATPFAQESGLDQTGFSFTPDDDGNYEVRLTVSDEDGGSSTLSQTAAVSNVAPTAAITGAPASSPEGTAIALGSSASDPAGGNDTFNYAWSVTKNGAAYGPTGSASDFTFTPDDNGEYVVTLVASDEDGGSTSVGKTITVTNMAPTPAVAGPAAGQRGFAVALQGSATDPGAVDTAAGLGYSWSVTLGGQPVDLTGFPATGSAFSFVPTEVGTYTVTLTVTDKDGGSTSTSHTVVVSSAAGATLLGNGLLVIVGTEAADDVKVTPGTGAPEILVLLNGVHSSFVGVTEIVVYANGGDDRVQVAGGVTVPATVFGGAGNDRIKAGGGPSVLVGGDGDDSLLGGAGRDVLIGGRGADLIGGNGADDILVAGYTALDGNLTALSLIRTEWVSVRSYADRVANLSGAGSTGVNGAAVLTDAGAGRTVFDDNAVDSLTGDAGNDWFVFNSLGGVYVDQATDLTAFEGLFDLDL